MNNYCVVTIKHEDIDTPLDLAPDSLQTPGQSAKAWLVCAYSQYAEPVVVENWYLLNNGAPLANIRLMHNRKARDLNDGQWIVNLPNSDYRVFTPPSTPKRVLKKDVPRPKSRVETRWNNGRWERYFKNKGWK